MNKVNVINKLIAVAVFIMILRMINIIAEILMRYNEINSNNQDLGFIFQIFISVFSAFFLIFAPSRYKFYYFLPFLILSFYGVLIFFSFILGEEGSIMYSIIYTSNVMISELMELCNKLFLSPGSKLSFLLINWIGTTCYLFIVSYISFNWFLSLIDKVTSRLFQSSSKF